MKHWQSRAEKRRRVRWTAHNTPLPTFGRWHVFGTIDNRRVRFPDDCLSIGFASPEHKPAPAQPPGRGNALGGEKG